MNDIKTYWLFYLKPEKLREEFKYYMTGKLYAYTDSKELRDIFLLQRNMKHFDMQKQKFSKKEIHAITEEFQSGYLVQKELVTHTEDNIIHKVSMVLTQKEYSVVMNMGISYMYSSHKLLQIDINTRIFAWKYREALDDLLVSYINMINKGEIMIIDDKTKLRVDELNVFMRMFGVLLDPMK